MKKFKIQCKKCGSENVEITKEVVGNVGYGEEDESSEWIELNCKNCGESEEVQDR